MNVKVFFVKNEDLFLDDQLENIDLVKELIQLNGFSYKLNEIIFLPSECVKGYDSALLVGLEGCSNNADYLNICLLYTSPSPRDPKTSRMPSSA